MNFRVLKVIAHPAVESQTLNFSKKWMERFGGKVTVTPLLKGEQSLPHILG